MRGDIGGASGEVRGDDLDQLTAVDGAATQFEVDGDVGADGGGGGEGGDVVGAGVDGGPELLDVRVVAQRLDAAGGGAGPDGHQSA
ncbi:hypothetical protein GCM10025734_16520 [Kitasatospora paranensis]